MDGTLQSRWLKPADFTLSMAVIPPDGPRSLVPTQHSVIDRDDPGEVKVPLIHHGHAPLPTGHGDCVAQLTIAPLTPATLVEAPDDKP